MFLCPRCALTLKSSASPRGRFLRCTGCGGRACTVTFLRKTVERDQVNRVWRAIYEQSRSTPRNCPSCERPMREVTIGLQSGTVLLDGCRGCQLVWFDDTELERLTPLPAPERPQGELPLATREAIARLELAQLDTRRNRTPDLEGPDELWKVLPAALGYPVEQETATLDRAPWATWGLAFAALFTSIAAMLVPGLAERLAWVPAEPERLGGAAFLTSFFVHAGPTHLLGNLYFLVTFGDDVEDLLGSARFLILILVAELVAALGHLLLATTSAGAHLGGTAVGLLLGFLGRRAYP